VRREDHQIRDIHDAHAQFGDVFAQESGGRDDFEGDLDADAD
jgi:hypothetical protein